MQDGIRLFETKDMTNKEDAWPIAVQAAGFDYNSIKHKIAAANRKRFILMFLDYLIEHDFSLKRVINFSQDKLIKKIFEEKIFYY